MTSGKYLLSITLSLVIFAGCSFKSDPVERPNELHASFQIGPLSATQVETVLSDPTWGVSIKKAYYLKGCVLDKATATPRAGEQFVLWKGTQSQVLEADLAGCVFWREEVSYLPLAPENYVSLTRRLEGNAGTELIRFAVNPWSDQIAFIDLDKQKLAIDENLVPESESEAAFQGRAKYRPSEHVTGLGTNLKVNHFEVDLGKASQNRARNLKGTFKIVAQRSKLDQMFTNVALPSGKFRVSLKFLSEDPETNRITQWAAVNNVGATLNHGELTFQTDLPLANVPADRSQKRVQYFLEPVDSSIGLLPSKGEMPINTLLGKSSGAPVEKPIDYEVNLALDMSASPNATIAPRRWSVSYSGERSFSPDSWMVRYRADSEICIIDSLTRLPLAEQTFLVGLSENEKPESARLIEVTTDAEGCLVWATELDYDSSQPEQFFEKYLIVKSEKTPYSGESFQIAVALNPWNNKGQLFFWDKQRKGNPPDIEASRESVVADKMTYAYLNPNFDLNRHLQLISHHNYQVKLKPELFRPTRTDGVATTDRLRKGVKLQVRGLLLHPLFIDKFRRGQNVKRPVLSGFETQAEIDERGDLNFAISLPIEFSQQALVDGRIHLLLHLSPLVNGEAGDIPSPVYLVPFKVVAGQRDLDDTTLTKSEYKESEFDKLWEEAHKIGATFAYNTHGRSFACFDVWKESPLDMWKEYWKGFSGRVDVRLDAKNEVLNWAEDESKSMQAFPFQLLSDYCNQLTTLKAKCLKSPRTFFHVSSMKVIEDIPNPRLTPPTVSTPLLQSAVTFFREFMMTSRDTEGRRNIREHAVNYNGKVGLGAYENGGSRSEAFIWQNEDFDAHETSVQRDYRVRYQFQEQQNLSAEGKHFIFNAKYRNCVVIRPLALVVATEPIPTEVVCSDIREGQLSESWYYIWDQWRQLSSSHVDPRDPWQRGWLKLIRGQLHYENFKNQLADGPRYYVMKKVAPVLEGVDPAIASAFHSAEGLRYRQDGGFFPGVSDYREASALLWTEQKIEELSADCSGTEPAATDPTYVVWKRKQVACRCIYEGAARLMPYGDYLTKEAAVREELSRLEIPKQCKALARKVIP